MGFSVLPKDILIGWELNLQSTNQRSANLPFLTVGETQSLRKTCSRRTRKFLIERTESGFEPAFFLKGNTANNASVQECGRRLKPHSQSLWKHEFLANFYNRSQAQNTHPLKVTINHVEL